MNKLKLTIALTVLITGVHPASFAGVVVPADPDLADLYSYSCQACHASSSSGAPVTGDTAAWEDRVAQGMDTLLERTINGYQAMPPLGSCTDCTAEDFIQLIEFMSTGKSQGE